MKTELSFIPNVHQMENAMAKERADFIEKQSDKIALRAIDRNGLMVGREFDDYKSAVDMARDYWIKGFCTWKHSVWTAKSLYCIITG